MADYSPNTLCKSWSILLSKNYTEMTFLKATILTKSNLLISMKKARIIILREGLKCWFSFKPYKTEPFQISARNMQMMDADTNFSNHNLLNI